jgi:cytochrome c553
MKAENIAIVGVVALAVLVSVATLSDRFGRPTGALLGAVAGIEAPRLDDPAMVRRGAAHYDRFCARCHASPDRPEQAAALDLSPSPPRLHLRAGPWSAEALFLAIKHGVRGTAMPAWPAQDRDDEIWDTVAFVAQLPGMEPEAYRALAGADAAAAHPAPLAICSRCHGVDGRGTPDGAFPRLDIQTPEYLFAALAAFRNGSRSSGFMQSAVAGLSDEELKRLAEHYGRPFETAEDRTPVSPGRPDRPACAACHGPPVPARPEFPTLTGQYDAYLRLQLHLLTGEHPRGGGPFVGLMHDVARSLSEPELDELAASFGDQR